MRAINMEFMPFLMKFSSFDLSSYDFSIFTSLSLSLPLYSGLSPSFSFLLNPYWFFALGWYEHIWSRNKTHVKLLRKNPNLLVPIEIAHGVCGYLQLLVQSTLIRHWNDWHSANWIPVGHPCPCVSVGALVGGRVEGERERGREGERGGRGRVGGKERESTSKRRERGETTMTSTFLHPHIPT